MAESGDCIREEAGGVDRISSLPRNIIDRILELVSTQDAVRTSILSSRWRYIWTDHPKLVINKQVYKEIMQNTLPPFASLMFGRIVHTILLQHFGPILKFVIDTSKPRRADIDLWLRFLSQKGVRELSLDNSSSGDGSESARYEIPSHIFSCSELTDLSISNCILKVPSTFGGFSKLNNLILEDIILGSSVLKTPSLVHLELRCCSGVCDFHISAPILEILCLEKNHDLELRYYMICMNLKKVCIDHFKVNCQGTGEMIHLIKLLGCWPRLLELSLDGLSLKNLGAGTIPKRLQVTLNYLRCLTLYDVNFDFGQIAWVLCILRSSPILQKFQIWAYSFVSDDVKVFNYLDETDCMKEKMEQLRIVQMRDFKGSRAELHFVKLLLGCSPSLERMIIQEDRRLAVSERLRIMMELLHFSRASTKASVIFNNV